jgi:hypothetical protein
MAASLKDLRRHVRPIWSASAFPARACALLASESSFATRSPRQVTGRGERALSSVILNGTTTKGTGLAYRVGRMAAPARAGGTARVARRERTARLRRLPTAARAGARSGSGANGSLSGFAAGRHGATGPVSQRSEWS